MNWFKNTFGKKSESPETNVISKGFTLYTINGYVENIKEEEWVNSEFEPLTETEKAFIHKIVDENKGKIFYPPYELFEEITKGFTKSCDDGRPDLFLGRIIQGKALAGVIGIINGAVKSISYSDANGNKIEITDPKEINETINKLGVKL